MLVPRWLEILCAGKRADELLDAAQALEAERHADGSVSVPAASQTLRLLSLENALRELARIREAYWEIGLLTEGRHATIAPLPPGALEN